MKENTRFFSKTKHILWNRTLRKRVKKTGELKHEINEHERAKQATLESETRYKGIVESSKNGVAVFKAVNEGEDFTLNFVVVSANLIKWADFDIRILMMLISLR